MNYYNEFDPYTAQWLRNLIAAHLIPDGYVDECSIVEVRPDDLTPYTQCHFFAGIGGWPYALCLAGWPADRPVWTGSCPCQPFSCAGKRKGTADTRHLWPEFFRLIKECRPSVVFGEQVASKDGLRWLDGVQTDLERADYACGACDLCAAGIRAPHIRQRLYWVAQSTNSVWRSECKYEAESYAQVGRSGDAGGLAHAERGAAERWRHDLGTTSGSTEGGAQERKRFRADAGDGRNAGRLEYPALDRRQQGRAESVGRGVAGGCSDGGLGDPGESGSQGRSLRECRRESELSPWSASIPVSCRDGKIRRISSQPGDVPLAYGIPRDMGQRLPALAGLVKGARRNRVGRLKGYGNAIVPQVAAEFIRACMP